MMSEQINDQVSAFVDDELSAEECAFLVRRFERNPDARGRLARYSLIGTALRGELGQADPDALRRRIQDALGSGAEAVRAPAAAAEPLPPLPGGQTDWTRPAIGVGIAATVALAALFGARFATQGGDDLVAIPQVTASALDTSSYIVPAEPREASIDTRVAAPPPIRLTNYLLHHGEYASRLRRTSVHSNVVGADHAPRVEPVVFDDAPPAPARPQ